jgi:hypothetical protein
MTSPNTAVSAPLDGMLDKQRKQLLRVGLGIAALSLSVVTIWILQRPYRGLNHDSVLYTLSALARLHPSLANDVFLRFGSQDSYTLFGPLYAASIRVLDLEPAAALLTFLGQLSFFLAAWALARRVMSARHALVAVGLLIALPSDYGALQDFSYIEGFLTPRQMAEALVLASLAATLADRRILGGICLLLGMLFHPIMAFAGLVMLFSLYVALPRPRLALVVAAAILAVSLGAALLISAGPFRPFDAAWLESVYSTGYLFISQWTIRDWSHLCVPGGALIVGVLTGDTPGVRKLCLAALLTVGGGILATLIFCDLLHVVIFTQAQPWRWLWLAQAIAVLLLPLIVPGCWRIGLLGRAAVLLIACAWELRAMPTAPGIVLAAIFCAASARRLSDWRHARLIYLGCTALLVLSILLSLLSHARGGADVGDLAFPARLAHWLNVWAGDGLLYIVALALVARQCGRPSTAPAAWLLAGAAALLCVFGPLAWHSWTTYQYTPQLRAQYARWREAIPPNAEVFWTASPVSVWYLLERADYWSPPQSAGDVFSREKALETQRRASLVLSALDAAGQRHPPNSDPGSPWYRPARQGRPENLDASGAAEVCADSALSFVVSRIPLGPSAYPEIVPNPNQPDRRQRLYRCADLSHGS